VPRGLADVDLAKVLDGCVDARERLIVSLMRQEGLRAIEVANLQLDDVDTSARTVIVKGKGAHESCR
jgi:site-specific recombinase XerC